MKYFLFMCMLLVSFPSNAKTIRLLCTMDKFGDTKITNKNQMVGYELKIGIDTSLKKLNILEKINEKFIPVVSYFQSDDFIAWINPRITSTIWGCEYEEGNASVSSFILNTKTGNLSVSQHILKSPAYCKRNGVRETFGYPKAIKYKCFSPIE